MQGHKEMIFNYILVGKIYHNVCFSSATIRKKIYIIINQKIVENYKNIVYLHMFSFIRLVSR